MTSAGLDKLPRGIPMQYYERYVLIANVYILGVRPYQSAGRSYSDV